MKKKILGLIVARKNSKGLINKNILKINSKPCIEWTFDAAKKSKLIDFAMLSTDSRKIIKLAKKNKIFCPFVRPKKLSKDKSEVHGVINHSLMWLKENLNYQFKYILLLQASSPLRTYKHIDEAIKFYFKNSTNNKDTLVSVVKSPIKTNWLLKKNGKYVSFLFKQKKNNMRQQNPIYYQPNGAIFFANIESYKNNFYAKNTLFFEMDEKSSVDIDSLEDVKKANLNFKS